LRAFVSSAPTAFSAYDRLPAIGRAAIALAITAACAVGLAFLLHRPRETSGLMSRLGATTAAGGARDVKDTRRVLRADGRVALRAALPPTIAFFAVLTFAEAASTTLVPALASVVPLVPLAVAVIFDFVVALRRPNMVPVWQERRPTAIVLARAILARDGIA